jgi:hypothetical protein
MTWSVELYSDIHFKLDLTDCVTRSSSATATTGSAISNTVGIGRAIAQAVTLRFPTAEARVQAQVSHVGFVVNKVALGQFLSEYFGFLSKFSFRFPLQILIPTTAPHSSSSSSSSSSGTTDQLVADVPSGFNLTPPKK